MHPAYIHTNLTRDLIRTFAVMDEWFDKEHPLHCYKPLSGGWCIHEVLEHVMLTNHYLLIIIGKGRDKALRKRDTLTEKICWPEHYILGVPALLEIANPQAFAWHRPDHHQPTGQRTLKEVRRALRNQLDDCLYTLETLPNGEGTLHQTMMSVNNLGKLDVYQYIYFLSLHAQRHLQQLKKNEVEFYASPVSYNLELK
jgi:hypothetical protein